MFDRFVDKEMYATLRWPLFGNPLLFEYGGAVLSPTIVDNVLKAQFVFPQLGQLPRRDQGLRVIEVGGGFGGLAQLLFQREAIHEYAFVDLAPNLLNTAVYTSCTLDKIDGRFMVGGKREGARRTEVANLTFSLPGDASHLEGGFDFAINTSSFGEMKKSVCRGYIDLFKEKLREGGLFVSCNGTFRQRDPDSVVHGFDYGYTQFEIVHFSPEPICGGLFFDHQHQIVLRKVSKAPAYPSSEVINGIFEVMSFGFYEEGRVFAQRLTNSTLDSSDLKFLEHLFQLLSSPGFEEKLEMCQASWSNRQHEKMIRCIEVVLRFVEGEYTRVLGLLREHGALDDLTGPAAIYIALIRALLLGSKATKLELETVVLREQPQLWPEIQGYLIKRDPRQIRYGLFNKVYRSPTPADSFLKKCISRGREKFELVRLRLA